MNKDLLKNIGRLAFELLKFAGLVTVAVICIIALARFLSGGAV